MKTSLLIAVLAGCALARKAPPLDVAYYEIPIAPRAALATAAPLPNLPALRLGDVTAATHLRERIVREVSPVEVDPYEARRWAETPDAYVRRALVRRLFEDHGLQQSTEYTAPTLEVTVTEFTEVAHGRHVGRVTLRYSLRDRRTVFAQGELAAERPIQRGSFDSVVHAIGDAMNEVTAQLADVVVRELASHTDGVAAAPHALHGAPRLHARSS